MSARVLRFVVKARPFTTGYATSARFDPDEDDDPREEVVEEAIASLATDIEIEAGGIRMHLAGWLDPEHWEADWREALGGEPFEGYLKFLLEGADEA